MIKSLFMVLVLLLSAVSLPRCASKPKRSRKPVTTVEILPRAARYPQGTNLSINLETKLKNGELKTVEVWVDNVKKLTSAKAKNQLTLKTNNLSMGQHQVRIVATKTDGIKGEKFAKFMIVSDIKPTIYDYNVEKTLPHSTEHFTQGLEIHDGFLFEGTGEKGSSALYKINLESGKVLLEHHLDNQYFGEGITLLNDKLYQLTYKAQKGFVYDATSFTPLASWSYPQNEGWGLTNDGHHLIMSDGSEVLRYLDPKTFEEVRQITVCNNLGPIKYLNELELIKGEIWANVWTTNTIIRIDPESGKVLGEIDLSGLLSIMYQGSNQRIDVLNGIAWDHATDHIYVTGKLWPKIFQIKLTER